MKLFMNFFIVFLFGILSLIAQPDNFDNDIIYYLEINGTEKQYDEAIDQMFNLLKKQYISIQIPDEVWKKVEEEKPEALKEIKEMLADVYKAHYTYDDIKNMTVLYQSEAGKQMMKNRNDLSEAQKREMADFYNTETGKKIIASQQSIANAISKISEVWSSNLYKHITFLLKNKGYVIQH